MKKRVIPVSILLILISILSILLLPTILAGSLDQEMQKLTHHAEQYEIGNINYVQLLVHVSSVRESLNEILGATGREIGGIVKQEKIKTILGEPNEETKWVWVEGREHETKLDFSVPIWRKIIFDGKKIQIRLEAFPSIFMKREFWEEFEDKEFEDDEEMQRLKKKYFEEFQNQEFTEEDIIYRLHFNIEFKRPEEQLDIQGKISEIQILAQTFNSNPSQTNAEVLAQQSVNAERIFEHYFKQNQGKCEDLMKSIFGSENQRQTQKLLVHEIEFYDGDNFEVTARLEMCDDCEWNWLNLDLWLDARGRFKMPKEEKMKESAPEQFEHMDFSGFEKEIIILLNQYKQAIDQKQWEKLNEIKQKIWAVNEAWNRKANDVWEEASGKKEDMTEQETIEFKKSIEELMQQDPYYWIKREQENRRKEEEIRIRNYETRKQFYLDLFSGYEKKEYYFTQVEFEKRLVEEFKEFGKEICNNNLDDNKNEQVDCDDAQCGGKICGRGTTTIQTENQTREETVDFYCIAGECKAKETEGPKKPVCGNHICELGEKICSSSIVDCSENETECFATMGCGLVYCPEDCIECPEHPPIECDGKVEFGGEDEKGCPLPPICIKEKEYCDKDEDCMQPKCGAVACIKENKEKQGTCKMTTLTKCGQGECEDGEKQIEECSNGEKITSAICIDGMWVYPDIWCQGVKEEVCCQIPGPADEPTYNWKLKKECQSPEGAEWPNIIVDESYCRKEQPKEDCNQYCMDYMSTIMPECPGDLEISGTYPDCKCNWVCEEIVKTECTMASDCGREDDVCSNGKCVAIPKIIETEPEEPIIIPELEESKEEQAKGLFGFFQALISRIRNPQITGRVVDEGDGVECPGIPKSMWCPDEKTLCPGKTDEQGCSAWDCDACPEETCVEAGGETWAGDPNCCEGLDVVSDCLPDQGCPISLRYCIDCGNEACENHENWDNCPEDCKEGREECTSGEEKTRTCESGEQITDKTCVDGMWKDTGKTCEGEEPPEDDEECSPGEEKIKPCGEKQIVVAVCADGMWEYTEEGCEDWDDEERERHEREQRENCERDCSRSCIDKCTREACGHEMECDLNEEIKKCEQECKPDNYCIEKCMEGGDWWKEFEEEQEEHKEEKGVFQTGGNCRTSQGKTEGFIWFGGWGDPFDEIEPLKRKYYEKEGDWCKHDLENLIKQRIEFEKGFNQEFAVWFFEKYLPNSAENWEQAVSGIFELYWNNINRIEQTAQRLDCLGINEFPDYNLISIEYETEYGKLEYWEERNNARIHGPQGDMNMEVVSPYMKIWIFPSKQFIIDEMKQAMINHEFPGPPEEKMERQNQEGPTEEEKQMIRQDEGFMKKIREITDKYGGSLDASVQFMDYETNEVVFNLFGKVNEYDILVIEPMLPEEVPEQDVKIEVDFELVYELIYEMEKEMSGERIESPPWDRKMRPMQKFNEIKEGIKAFFKIRKIINSAKYTPAESEKDIKSLFKSFIWMMMKKGGDKGGGDLSDEQKEELKKEMKEGDIWEDKEKTTGEVVLG